MWLWLLSVEGTSWLPGRIEWLCAVYWCPLQMRRDSLCEWSCYCWRAKKRSEQMSLSCSLEERELECGV